MELNKRGFGSFEIIFIVAGLLVLIAILSYASNFATGFIEGLPDAVGKSYEIVKSVATPIVTGIYFLVAPAGEPENVQMIAFAIFLLLFLVGYESTKSFFKNPALSLIISGIIGLIAGRSLTSTILSESALAASPVAAAALLVGLIPIFALTKRMRNSGLNSVTRLVFFLICSVVYALIFSFAFQATTLGIVYGIGILLIGIAEMMAPLWVKKYKWAKDIEVGRIMGDMHVDIVTATAIAEGRKSKLNIPPKL